MRKIYENMDFTPVGHFQSILESEGIRCLIKNLGSAAAVGEIPFLQAFPELWVVDDCEYDRALEVLRPYYCHDFPVSAPWTCAGCGEVIEGTFGECWKCQAACPSAGSDDGGC